MKFGASIFLTDYSIGPVELGQACEERGFESLFLPEHTHIPTSRRTPFPGGSELPKHYADTLDPFVALSAIAATTQRLKLGTGISLVIERDPIVLAKEVASLDMISGGAGALRRRRRLEPRGDGEPRHRSRAPLEAAARAYRGDEGALDRGRAPVPRRVRRLRPGLAVAEARAEARTRRSCSATSARARCGER